MIDTPHRTIGSREHLCVDLDLAWRLLGTIEKRREIAKDEFLRKSVNECKEIVGDAWLELASSEIASRKAHAALGRVRRTHNVKSHG